MPTQRKLFEDYIKNFKAALPKNKHEYEYILRINEVHIPVIFKSYSISKVESGQYKYYKLQTKAINCVLVLWNAEYQEAILTITSELPNDVKCKTHRALLHNDNLFTPIPIDNIVIGLFDFWKTFYADSDDKSTIDNSINECLPLLNLETQRALNKSAYGGCQDLEAKTIEYIKNLLLNQGTYWATPAATCLADAGFRLISSSDKNLGLQMKVANQSPTGNYTFNRCNNYPGMIIICRPLPYDKSPSEFLVMPNDYALPTINKSFQTSTHQLFKFRVPEVELVDLLVNIFRARSEERDCITWPSGAEIDISGIDFFTADELNTPTSAKCKKEYENVLKRERRFPELQYEYPNIQATYDVKINDLEVQDKCAEESLSNFYRVKLQKNLGNVNKNRKKGGYEVGDFEFLWVHLPDCRGFFLLPSAKLIEHGVLKNDDQPGKTWVSCFPPGWFPSRKGNINMWTKEFYINWKSAGAKSKILQIFEIYGTSHVNCHQVEDKIV